MWPQAAVGGTSAIPPLSGDQQTSGEPVATGAFDPIETFRATVRHKNASQMMRASEMLFCHIVDLISAFLSLYNLDARVCFGSLLHVGIS